MVIYLLIYFWHFCSFQAGDLYEKVNRNDEALQCYKKGYAYRRGNSVACYKHLFSTWKRVSL